MARRFRPRYDASDVMSMYQQARDSEDEARLRTIAETMRKLCRLEHRVEIPEQYRAITKEIRTPFIRDAWARISASLVSKPPVVQVEPRDEQKREYRDAATIASRWDMEFVERQAKDGDEDAMYQSTSNLVRDGESVLKIVHVPDAWATFPKMRGLDAEEALRQQDEYKRHTDLPIAWRAVDRLSCVFGEGEYGTEWVIEYGEYPLPYAKAKWGYEVDRDGHAITPEMLLGGRPRPEGALVGSSGRCIKHEFVDANEWHVVVDGVEAPGFPRPNPYAPHLNYFRAKANESESLLYSLMHLVPGYDALMTMVQNWAYLGAYPNPVEESVPQQGLIPGLDGPEGSAPNGKSPILWKPGKYLQLPPGKRLSFLMPPPIGQDVKDLISVLRGMIEVAGIPAVMRGGGGAESGYQENQMLAAASLMYRLASQSLERQFSEGLDFVHWMVPNVIKQSVWVKGYEEIGDDGRPNTRANRVYLALSPDATTSKDVAHVGKLGPVTVMYRPTLPTDEQARAMIANQLVNSPRPLISKRYAMRHYLGVDDPDGMLDEISVEEALEQEPLKSMVTEQALREAGLLPAEEPQAQPAPGAAMVPPDQAAAAAGGMVPPGPMGLSPIPPGQAAAGMPAVPGLTMPVVPTPPQGIPGNVGGRPAGMYPGLPPSQV